MRRVIPVLIATAIALTALPTVTTAAKHSMVEEGKQLAFNRTKGNCLSCHMIADGVSPGNIGPPLVSMKTRFKSMTDVRNQIWDPTKHNPETSMPPFGRHNILSDAEIEKIAAYIWTL